MFKVNNKDNTTTPLTSIWLIYYKLWTYFAPFPNVCINFDYVYVYRHDSVFINQVTRYLIIHYTITNEISGFREKMPFSVWIWTLFWFGFLSKLADELNLRIMRKYGAIGHGKSTIDATSNFGGENTLRQDIVPDIFF